MADFPVSANTAEIAEVERRVGAKAGTPIPEFGPGDARRFWAKVQMGPEGECWPWIGGSNGDGYGRFKLSGKLYSPHRIAATLGIRPIPAGHLVLHRCDNPRCCNPSHLTVGTASENTRDAIAKGRQVMRRGCEVGTAKLDEATVRAIRADRRSTRVLAKIYGVGSTCISKIKRREAWKHVA